MTLRCSAGCVSLHLELLQLYCRCLTDTLFQTCLQTIWTFSFADAPAWQSWLLSQSPKPREQLLKNFLMFIVGIKFFFFLFSCREGGCIAAMAVHCGLLFQTSDPLSTFYSIAVSLTYNVALLFWRSIQPLAIRICFSSDVLQEFKRSSSMPGFVLIWAMYFWAYLGALAWHSLMQQSLNAQSLEKRPTMNRTVLFCCGPSNFAFLFWAKQLIGKKKCWKWSYFTVEHWAMVEALFWRRGTVAEII